MEICIVGICGPGEVWWYTEGRLSFYFFLSLGVREEKARKARINQNLQFFLVNQTEPV